MKLVTDKNIKQIFLDYDSLKTNIYDKNQIKGFLTKSAEKFNCEIDNQKISKSIVRSNILYKNNLIGYLNGVRPSSTQSEAVRLANNPKNVKEYLNLQGVNFDEKVESSIRIRLYFSEGRYAAASVILPPFVIGNGKSTVEELIAVKNENRKSTAYFNRYSISLDTDIKKESVISEGDVLIVSQSLETAAGSETMDITDTLSNSVIEMAAETVAAVPGLYTAGVDIDTDSIKNPQSVSFVSLVASPSPLIHYLPFKGQPVDIYGIYLESLLVQYKVNSNISLNDNDITIKTETEEFENKKIHYLDNLNENIIKNAKVSKELLQHLGGMDSKSLIEKSKADRDLARKNLVVDENIFKPVDKDDVINVTPGNILRLVKQRKDSSAIAFKALNNEIIPFPGFDSVVFDKYYFYTDKTKKYGPSYQLYIQALRIVAVLLAEYEKNNNIRYLYKAEELIYEWISYVSKGTEERMVWYDHPAANRTQALIHFIYLADKAGLDIDYNLFRSILNKHGEVLGNDDIYINNNHGLMMDKSLMILGNVLKEERFFLKGYYRSIDTFWYSFSSQGTHVENSPEYHNMVVRMYVELQKYLENNGQTYNDNIISYLGIAKNYLGVILKPNLLLPPVGDSGNLPLKVKKVYKNFYDLEAGMSVMQYKSEKSFYVNFICGYSSKTHKHKDDLSINLNYNGEDFLTDAGKFNYNGKSPLRKYVISKNAHSSFQLKDYNYQLNRTNRFDRKIKLNGFNFTDNINMVKGLHSGYSKANVDLNRAVFQIKNKPVVIIYDFIDNHDDSSFEFVQNFNLSEKISVDKERKIVKLNGKNESMVIKQLLKADKPQIVEGDMNKPVAINTIGFAKAIETTQVKFARKANERDVFVTAIFDDRVIKDIELIDIDSSLNIKMDGEVYHLNI